MCWITRIIRRQPGTKSYCRSSKNRIILSICLERSNSWTVGIICRWSVDDLWGLCTTSSVSCVGSVFFMNIVGICFHSCGISNEVQARYDTGQQKKRWKIFRFLMPEKLNMKRSFKVCLKNHASARRWTLKHVRYDLSKVRYFPMCWNIWYFDMSKNSIQYIRHNLSSIYRYTAFQRILKGFDECSVQAIRLGMHITKKVWTSIRQTLSWEAPPVITSRVRTIYGGP